MEDDEFKKGTVNEESTDKQLPTSSDTLPEWEEEVQILMQTLISKFKDRKRQLELEKTSMQGKQVETLKSIAEREEEMKSDIAKEKEELERSKEKLCQERLQLKMGVEEEARQMRNVLTQLQDSYERKLQKLEEEKIKMSEIYSIQESKIKLDIGGVIFTTSKSTICKFQDSMFAAMFSGRHRLVKEEDGSYFIDRDGTHFRYILNFLRGEIRERQDLPDDKNILRELRKEAEFYQLHLLSEFIEEILEGPPESQDFSQEEINEILSTVVRVEKPVNQAFQGSSFQIPGPQLHPSLPQWAQAALLPQHQGFEGGSTGTKSSARAAFVSQNMTKKKLDFAGKNLMAISFAHTTFNHTVSFLNAKLTGANFYGCEFGVGIIVDFSGADLRGCDFRNCKGKEAGPKMSFGPSTFEFGSGGLVSGSSSELFLKQIQEKRIIFKGSKLDGSLFDPVISEWIFK